MQVPTAFKEISSTFSRSLRYNFSKYSGSIPRNACVACEAQLIAQLIVHKLISIDVHCDLDLWPLTSKINRVHPLIMVNMSSKFDKEICNGVDSIAFTRSMHGQTDGTTEPQQCCTGIIKNWLLKSDEAWLTCLPSLIKKSTTVKSLLCSQAYFHRCPLWPWPLTSDLQNQ